LQTIDGLWRDDEETYDVLARFTKYKILPEIPMDIDMKITSNKSTECWHTVVAMFILQERFWDRQGEWELIWEKAKLALKNEKVKKVVKYLKKETMAFIRLM
jgi:hypothetical protein